MSRARDYRRGKDGRAEDRFAGRKRRYKPLLAALGLEEAFNAVPRFSQEQLWAVKFPDAALEYDDGVPAAARAAVERAFVETTTEIQDVTGGRTRIPARDMTSVLFALYKCVNATALDRVPPATADFIRKARPILNATYDRHFGEGGADLMRYVQWAAVGHSRADGRVIGMRGEYRDMDTPKPHVAYAAVSAAPECVRATRRGRDRDRGGLSRPRPAYRVGYSRMPDGIRWVSWPMREMGLGPEESLPVFVQGHALRHLQERMDGIDEPGWPQWYLARALDEPNVVRRQPDGSWLVEYRINENRCGYLAVGRADCGLLVRTFLFLTMRGTPEGDRLHRRFHLTRGEADWLNLHRFSSFTRTDLGTDAELREILTACDCGHLLDMNTEDEISPRVGFAAQVRKFVGMSPAAAGEADGDVDGADQTVADASPADVRRAA